MTVKECMERMTYKEYKVWVERIKNEIKDEGDKFYETSLTDLYLIRLAMETRLVRNAVLRIPTVPEVESFIIGKEKEKPVDESKKTKSLQVSNTTSQAVWQRRIPGAKLPDFEKWQASQISSSDS